LNIIHELRHNLNILVVFRVTHSVGAIKYPLKLVLDLFEGARKAQSVQD